MLKEGWDVRNVTTVVGLRAYSAKSSILPEQTLGRGLRKMYSGETEEKVSVVGTDAFMDFVESIQAEGVQLEHAAMGEGTQPKAPLVVEVDREKDVEALEALDIEIPVLTPHVYREYAHLAGLDVVGMEYPRLPYRQFSEEERRKIIFKDLTTGQEAHTTFLDPAGVADYRSVIGYFAQTIIREMRLVSGYDVLFGKIKAFVQTEMFDRAVELEEPNTLRNLSEITATKKLTETFKKAINDLTIQNVNGAEIRDTIKLSDTRPFVAKDRAHLRPKKSVFNRIIGDNSFELEFAQSLEEWEDVTAYAKNYFAVRFKLDYVNADGDISNYYPDFIVKRSDGSVFIIETKGREELDVPLKMARLKEWCRDVNQLQSESGYDFVYVDQPGFEQYKPKSFRDLAESFTSYKNVNPETGS